MDRSVLPVFRSDAQGAILDVVLGSDAPVPTRDVIDRTGVAQPSAHRELRRLTDAGILTETRIGRSALFAADETNPAVPHLRALLAIAFGPQRILSESLSGIEGIERALIFGSFAARAAGVPGSSPRDVDLLIVGTPERAAVYDALEGLDSALRREVNVTFLRPERWAAGDEELVKRIAANPTIELRFA